MNILPIGTIVRLKGAEHKLMITARTPLIQENGVTGYFDYGGCLYPNGQTSSNSYFFNEEEIEEVYFRGYVDEQELAYREEYEKEIGNVKYPKFKVEDNKLFVTNVTK